MHRFLTGSERPVDTGRGHRRDVMTAAYASPRRAGHARDGAFCEWALTSALEKRDSHPTYLRAHT